MTTFVLVHGMWGGPGDWDDVIAAFGNRARCVAADLPSCRLPDATLADDAAHVRALIDDDDVVLVGHSYGGLVITECGDTPAVRHLVYVAALMADKGETAFEITSSTGDPDASDDLEVRDDGTSFVTGWCEGDAWSAYSPDQLARMRTRPRRPASIDAALSPCSVVAWRSVPSTYVVATRDTALPAAVQRSMATRATRTVEVEGEHFVINQAPEQIAGILSAI